MQSTANAHAAEFHRQHLKLPDIPSSLLLHHCRHQVFRALHVHRLHIAVQLLLRTLLVVALPADADPDPVWYTLYTALPDFLVELWI